MYPAVREAIDDCLPGNVQVHHHIHWQVILESLRLSRGPTVRASKQPTDVVRTVVPVKLLLVNRTCLSPVRGKPDPNNGCRMASFWLSETKSVPGLKTTQTHRAIGDTRPCLAGPGNVNFLIPEQARQRLPRETRAAVKNAKPAQSRRVFLASSTTELLLLPLLSSH